MLQLFKNDVVTSTSLLQADVRKYELELYTKNFWVWGGTSTVLAGFLFEQITSPVPESTPWNMEFVYLASTALCLGLSLCIITWSVIICMWGPGMALRGPDGMKSFHDTIEFMKTEHRRMYYIFMLDILTYFGSTCAKVWVFPSREKVNLACSIALALIFVVLLVMQFMLECRIGGSLIEHQGEDGRIHGLRDFEGVGDLDTHLAG
mmetsp:Transcript_57183/g.90901  ORF Transcript_57183/g.90901 Transcript_57183/m.90901 type:complete len:206 (+) Transcript_57183:44-661(+)